MQTLLSTHRKLSKTHGEKNGAKPREKKNEAKPREKKKY
jgi:hypothetical protein